MRLLFLLLIVLGLCSCATKPEIPEEKVLTYKTHWFYKKVPQDCDEIEICNPSNGGAVVYRIKGKGLYEELNRILDFKPVPDGPMTFVKYGCPDGAHVYFKRKGKRIGKWSYKKEQLYERPEKGVIG